MKETSRRQWSRVGALALAWLFVACLVIQIFLAGLALFDNALRWQDHRDFGHTIGLLLVPLFLLVVIGRLPRQAIGMAVVQLILYLVQISLPNLSAGYIAAVHPLVGFALLGLSIDLARHLSSLTSAPRDARPTAAPVEAVGRSDEASPR